MSRRALLIFADGARLDLARRRLPLAVLPLLRSPGLGPISAIAADVHIFGSGPDSAATRAQFHPQRGGGFAERLENAVETLAALGYTEIVAIGRDCPALAAADIAQAFERLRDNRLVLGPDHRGGCYLIAFRASDRALLGGIRWKRNTDCAELAARVARSTVFLLPTRHDIDSWADLQLAARANDNVARLVAFIFRSVSAGWRQVALFVHADAQFVRVHGQMPPPRFAI